MNEVKHCYYCGKYSHDDDSENNICPFCKEGSLESVSDIEIIEQLNDEPYEV